MVGWFGGQVVWWLGEGGRKGAFKTITGQAPFQGPPREALNLAATDDVRGDQKWREKDAETRWTVKHSKINYVE